MHFDSEAFARDLGQGPIIEPNINWVLRQQIDDWNAAWHYDMQAATLARFEEYKQMLKDAEIQKQIEEQKQNDFNKILALIDDLNSEIFKGYGMSNGGKGGKGNNNKVQPDYLQNANKVELSTLLFDKTWGEAARDASKMIPLGAEEMTAVKVFGFIGQSAKYLSWTGEFVSVSAAIYTVIDNPSAGNFGRLGVTSAAIGSNFIPFVGPGVSISIFAADQIGWFQGFYDWLDN